MPVQEFGPYRLVELLGKGGMGEVWRAHDTTHDDRVVAVKVLGGWLDHGSDGRYARRFHRESALAAHLGSPHIVPIHRYGEIDGRLYLDMQLVNGVDLAALLAREGPLAPERAVAVVAQVAEGLDAAHDAGLVHRDVKPSNILVTTMQSGADHAYVIDFGIARAADSATASEELIGTLAYMAPERFDGHDGRSCDIYALGCVLYETLVGAPPFGRGDAVTMMRRHLDVPPPRPTEARDTLSPALDAVLAMALAKRPADRYASASSLAAAARAALAPSAAATQTPAVLATAEQPELVAAAVAGDATWGAPWRPEGTTGAVDPEVAAPLGSGAPADDVAPASAPDVADPAPESSDGSAPTRSGPLAAPPATPRGARWPRRVLIAAVAVLLCAGLAVPVVLSGRPQPVALVPAPPRTAAAATSPSTPAANASAGPSTGAPVPATTGAPTAASLGTPATTVAPPPPTVAAPPLDARHQALLNAVQDDGGIVRSTCAPLPSNEKGLVNTAIVCSTANPALSVPIGFYRLNSPTAYTARVTGQRKQIKQPGRCQDGKDAVTSWALAGAAGGYVSCQDTAAGRGFVIRWGAKGSLVEARVQGRDAAKVYDWWQRHAAVVPVKG